MEPKLKHTTLILGWLLQQLLFLWQASEPTEIPSPLYPPPLGFPTWDLKAKMQEPGHEGPLSDCGNDYIHHPQVEDVPDTIELPSASSVTKESWFADQKWCTEGIKENLLMYLLFFLGHLQFWPNWLVQVSWEAENKHSVWTLEKNLWCRKGNAGIRNQA